MNYPPPERTVGADLRPDRRHLAAPTTSLPEQAGGVRNWDYRYCWLRDATFTLLALGSAGYYDEAREWRDWLLRAVAGRPDQLQIMYGLGGERRLIEWEVPWLPEFDGARPARVGITDNERGEVRLTALGRRIAELGARDCSAC